MLRLCVQASNLGWAATRRCKLDGQADVVADHLAPATTPGRRPWRWPWRLLAAPLDLGCWRLAGGADNDEVYTFAFFHYAVAGLRIRF
jgi:hypothetical protein